VPVNATIDVARATGTILNATEENSQATLSIADASVIEGNSGTTQIVFTVTMPFPSSQVVTVNYMTANSTALAGHDYISASGTLIFLPGMMTNTITVQVVGDVVHEPNEGFFVTLSQPVHAALVRNRALGTIVNDEALPKITIHDTSTVEGDNGTRYMEFDLSLSAPSSKNITVEFATADGSALAPHSYAARSGILVFPSGTLTQCVAVVISGNITIEADKTVRMLLSKAVNATILDGEGVGTIVNDDGLPGHLDNFVWSAIASPQTVNQPFNVTITAKDRFGGPVPDYSGIVNITASAVSLDQGNHNLLGAPTHQAFLAGLVTVGYAFTPNRDIVVTHVRHYSGTKVSIWKNNGQLVASQPVVSAPGTWRETALSSPVLLQAGTTYRLGVRTSGYYARFAGSTTFTHGALGGNFQAVNDVFPTVSAPGRAQVDIRYSIFGAAQPVAVSPVQSGVFVNGVWSGQITVPATADLVTLRAEDGFGHAGDSGSFAVTAGSGLHLAFNSGASNSGGAQLLSAGTGGLNNMVQLFFTPGSGYVIEASTDLSEWSPVFTNSNGTASSYFVEPVSTGQRFYRAIMLP
jgi:hypothetical protein